MKHYVVVLEWSTEGDNGSNVIGVTHHIDDAKNIFNDTIAEERDLAANNGWTIYEDTDTVFDAGEDGFYCNNHSKTYIQEVM